MKKYIILFAIFFNFAFAVDSPSYSREIKLNRVNITFQDLIDLSSLIQDSVNKEGKYNLKLKIGTEQEKISFFSFEQILTAKLKEKEYTQLWFYYRASNQDLEEVDINLSYGNNITITGVNQEKVDTLYLKIKDFFVSRQPLLASKELKFIITLLSFLGIPTIILLFIVTQKNLKPGKELTIEDLTFFDFILLGAGIILIIYLLWNVDKIVPDFLLVPKKIPWYEEYQGLLVLIGLSGTFITIVKWIFNAVKNKK